MPVSCIDSHIYINTLEIGFLKQFICFLKPIFDLIPLLKPIPALMPETS